LYGIRATEIQASPVFVKAVHEKWDDDRQLLGWVAIIDQTFVPAHVTVLGVLHLSEIVLVPANFGKSRIEVSWTPPSSPIAPTRPAALRLKLREPTADAETGTCARSVTGAAFTIEIFRGRPALLAEVAARPEGLRRAVMIIGASPLWAIC
jgi:hypothetical protein